jgi:hypothetical protein
MGYISQGDLVQNMTPEQRILVAGFYSKFDIGSGLPMKKIINVEPILLTGAMVGEIITYADNKLYLCLELSVGWESLGAGALVNLLDELNAVYNTYYNLSAYWDVTAVTVKYVANKIDIKNTYFSRITALNYIWYKFIGYRITLGTV